MKKKKKINIPLLRPYFNSDEISEIKKVLDSGWVSQGPKVKEFENKIKDFLKVKYAIAVSNCTAALHLSLLALNIGKDDEVLVADYTFPATGHSVLYCRAKPVFVDIDPLTYNINPDLIENKITNKIKAIIPVHTFGQSAAMDKIMKIAEKYNLKIIEDAACSLGGKYKNRFTGTIGDIGCFSFHARKGITTGEGGMVVTNNKEYAKMIRKLSVFGIENAWSREESEFSIPTFNELGFNYKMSDISAAIGVAQIKKLDFIIKRKQKLAKYMDEQIRALELIKPPYVDDLAKHVYQSYVTLIDKRINRNKLVKKLKKIGIQTQIGTYASHIQPVYKSEDECPVSLDVFNRALALPMYYSLKEKDIDFIINNLKHILEEVK